MTETAKAAKQETFFRCTAPDAQQVFLAGTFNDWDPAGAPMMRDLDGRWTLYLDLAVGTYEYKFFVDGQWCCESGSGEAAEGGQNCVPNAFGTMNSMVTVE